MALLTNGYGRMFVSRDVGCSQSFSYIDCGSIGAVAQSRGEPELTYKPSARVMNEFVVTETIPGSLGSMTSTITAYLEANSKSVFERAFETGCLLDIHVLYGQCNVPTDYSGWQSMYALGGVSVNSYDVSDLTTLTPDGRAVVTETMGVTISTRERLLSATVLESPDVIPHVNGVNTFTIADYTIGPAIFCHQTNCANDNCGTSSSIESCDVIAAPFYDNVLDSTMNIMFTLDGGRSWWAKGTVIDHPDDVNQRTPYMVCSNNKMHLLTGSSGNNTGTIHTLSTDDLFDFNVDDMESVGTASVPFYGASMYACEDYVIVGSLGFDGVIYDTNLQNPVEFNIGGSLNGFHCFEGTTAYPQFGGEILVSTVAGAPTTSGIFSPDNSVIEAIIVFGEQDWLVGTQTSVYCTKDGGRTFTQVISFNNGQAKIAHSNGITWATDGERIYISTDNGGTWRRLNYSIGATASNALSIDICPDDANYVAAVAENKVILVRPANS